MVHCFKRTQSILVLFLLCFSIEAQVSIDGEVSHIGENQDNVTIQVFENGKLSKTIAANKRGKYHIDFPFNHEYLLVFRSPYMIPVSIEMNTELPQASSDNLLVEVPLNMELFQRFKDLDIRAYQDPIGIIHKTGDSEQPFAFYPNSKTLEAIKLVNAKSMKMELAGVEPISTSDDEIESMVFVVPKVDTKNTTRVEPSALKPEETTERRMKTESADAVVESIAAADLRYKKQEEGEMEEKDLMRNKLKQKQSSKIEVSGDKQAYIYSDKEAKRDRHEQEFALSQELIDSKILKQQQIDNTLISKSEVVNAGTIGNEKNAQEKTLDQGFVVTEEVLKIRVGNNIESYKHVNYDWLLFELDYYYVGEKEITQKEYEDARKLFD